MQASNNNSSNINVSPSDDSSTSLVPKETTSHNNSIVSPRPLSELRTLIDAVDSALVRLLNDRSRLVIEVGQRKAADGTPVYAPHREQAVLAKVLAQNTGPLLNSTLESIYREIMSGSFALERPLRIGYLGPPGSFSHDAAVKQFGKSIMYENLRTIEGVFEEVARGHVDYGLVPIENASIGSVPDTLDGILAYCGRASLCAEVQLSVCQALITCPGAIPRDITEIHSKPEALGQCRKWLATQYPNAALVPAASTSAAVEMVAKKYNQVGTEGTKHIAAIGSSLAASLFDLPVMFGDIQDVTPNITRFIILCSSGTAAAVSAPSGDDKTSILFVCDDRPGALVDVLDAFRRHSINLTHIDKRPCSSEHLTQLVNASDKKKLVALSNNPNQHTITSILSPSAGSITPTATDTSTNNNPNNTALTGFVPRSPSPVQIPAMSVAPSLYVPAMLGGRGGLTTTFTYAFFIEAVGHITQPELEAALIEAAPLCLALKVLGSYPRARRVL